MCMHACVCVCLRVHASVCGGESSVSAVKETLVACIIDGVVNRHTH